MTTNSGYIYKASFSTLDVWYKGDYERAIKYYFKLDKFQSPEMAQGEELHKRFKRFIDKEKKLPAIFGGRPLAKPFIAEKFLNAQVDSWLELRGRLDLHDGTIITDFKTGQKTANEYANSWQGAVYSVLCTLCKIPVTAVDYHTYDQYSKKAGFARVWVTDKLLEDGYNWILTYSSEMHDYLLKNGLYQKYDHLRS
jgi:hypothetical protein